MEEQKANNRADGTIICRYSPKRITELVSRSSTEKIVRITELGFGGTTEIGITQLPIEMRKSVLAIYDMSSQTFRVGSEMSLKLTEEDVHNVYDLPRGAKIINLDKTLRHDMDSMVGKCRLTYAKATKKKRVELKELKDRMDTEEDLEKWCQMYVLYLSGTVIYKTAYQQASMKYAGLLKSDSLGELIDYN